MARVTYILPITELTGSIGGVTFQRNASGTIARLKPIPITTRSGRMLVNEENVNKVVVYWHTLNSFQQNIWDLFADLYDHVNEWDESRHLSGFQWFMSLNLNLLTWSKAMQDAPPVFSVVAKPTPYILSANSTGLKIIFDDPYTAPRTQCSLYMLRPIRSTTLNTRRYLYKVKQFTPVAMSEMDVTADFEATFNLTWSTFFPSFTGSLVAHVKQGPYLDGLCGPFGSAKIITGSLIPFSVQLKFDSLANASGMIGGDATILVDWNLAFGSPAHPFTSINVSGNTVTLSGAEDVTVPDSLFSTDWDGFGHLISVIDTGCLTHAENHAFGDMNTDSNGTILETAILPALQTTGVGCFWSYANPVLVTASFPSLITASDYSFGYQKNMVVQNFPSLVTAAEGAFISCEKLSTPLMPKLHTIGPLGFDGCIGLTVMLFPLLGHLGFTAGDDLVFQNIAGKTITLTVPVYFQTNNGGNPDGDIQALAAANALTVIYI